MSRPWTAVYASILTSARLASLPDDACRLFYTDLLLVVDGHGSVDARPHVLHAKVWPLLGKPLSETVRAVLELERAGLVEGHGDGVKYWLSIPDWDDKAGVQVRKTRRAAPEYGSCPGTSRRVPDIPGYSGSVPAYPGVSPRKRERSKRDPRETVERQKKEEPEAPPRPARKEPTGPQADCVRFWVERWGHTRGGAVYVPATKDFVAVANLIKIADGNADEVMRRMDLMLHDSEEWMFKNASPTMMLARWNQYGVEGQRRASGRRAEDIPDL